MKNDNHSPSMHQIDRRRFLALSAYATGAAALMRIPGARAAKAPGTVDAGFFVETKPTMIAKGQGYFEKLTGSKFSWIEAGSGGELNTAFASGSLDIAFSLGSSPCAAGISQSIPYQVVAMVDNIGAAEEMVVRKAAGIKKPADFVGKKVATPFGSTSQFRLLGFLKVHGLNERDVTVLDLAPNAMVAAWQRGDIDAGYVWSPAKSKLLEMDGEPFPTYQELDPAGYVIADIIVASNAFVEKFPDTLTAIVRAYGQALNLWKNQPDDAAKIVGREAGVTPAVAKANMQEYDFVSLEDQLAPNWLGKPGKPGSFATVLKSTADFLVEQKSIRAAPGLKTFQQAINTTFLQKAIQ